MASNTKNLNLTLPNQNENFNVEVLNNNFSKLDALATDFVEEEGKVGDWYYRKWHNGAYECHGLLPGEIKKTFLNAGIVYTCEEDLSWEFPYPFADNPVVHVFPAKSPNDSADKGTGISFAYKWVNHPTNKVNTGDWRIANFMDLAKGIWYFSVSAYGRWA